MPISPDSNIPTVPGLLQVVSFHLLSRTGEKIDLENGTFIVENITDLDAHLALEADPDREATEDGEAAELARAYVLVRHDKKPDNSAYTSWIEFKVAADGKFLTFTEGITNATNWQRFAYNGELNPVSDRPCFIGEEFNRYVSFVDRYFPEDTFGIGDDIPGFKIELSNSQDAALFASNNPVSIPGTIEQVESNATVCTLGTPIFSDFDTVGWQFNPADFPKENPSTPDAKVKLLWLAGLVEFV